MPVRISAMRALGAYHNVFSIESFMTEKPFSDRRPVFVGDDEIDRAGFDAVLGLGGLAFSVGTELPGLSGVFSGPDAVRRWPLGLGR